MRIYKIAKVEQPDNVMSESEIASLREKSSQFNSPEEFIRNVMPEYLKYDSEEDFIEYHRTGHISSDAYSDYEKTGGLSWMGEVSEHPVLVGTIKTDMGIVEVRKSGERNQYVKTDEEGDIVRNDDYSPVYLSDDEMSKLGLASHDTSLVGFNDEGRPVALVSDEFGSDGVWVEGDYQGLGLGTAMLHEFRKEFKPGRKIGQMTSAGDSMSRKLYRRMEQRAMDLKAIWERANNDI